MANISERTMLNEQDVVERLWRAVGAAGGQRRFAALHGFTPAYVHDVLHGRRAPADRICAALGLERLVVYRERTRSTADV